MGPRPGGRGRRCGQAATLAELWRFNGATARRPWKTAWLTRPGSRRTSFNGATARRPWKTSWSASRWPRVKTRFNGATARRPWKTGEEELTQAGVRVASMGPRPGGRGRRRSRVTATWFRAALQWGHGPEAVEDFSASPSLACQAPLQWGHGPEAVEDRGLDPRADQAGAASMGPRPGGRGRHRHLRDRFAGLVASMGPRPGGRGRRRSRGWHGSGWSSFNGATARRPWKTAIILLTRSGDLRFNGATARRPWKTKTTAITSL